MTNRLITPPAARPVSMADARLAARADGTELDTQIQVWIDGIAEYAEQYTSRAIITQSRRVTLDSFPDAIQLDYAPIIAVQSVTYLDSDGVSQVLSPADYLLDNVSEPGYVVPAYGTTWPDTYAQINAVAVNYTCGYGADDTYTPAAFKNFILAKLAEQFDPAVRGEKGTIQSSFIDRLLDSRKVYG